MPQHCDAMDQLASRRCTPPEDLRSIRQVSWLAGRCCCPAFPVLNAPVALIDSELAAYSCGGSPGIAAWRLTGFPLGSAHVAMAKNRSWAKDRPERAASQQFSTQLTWHSCQQRHPRQGQQRGLAHDADEFGKVGPLPKALRRHRIQPPGQALHADGLAGDIAAIQIALDGP